MRRAILTAVAVLLPWASRAADDIKPFDAKLGLWESTNTTEMGGMPSAPQIPEEQLAKMPPQQRAQIEAMLKARGGAPRTSTAKFCVTKETLSRGLSFNQRDNGCTQKVVSSSPSRQEIHVECPQGKMPMTGDVTIERVDAEHVKGTMSMKSSGGPMQMKSSFNTKWLSADCGDVKPAGGN